MRAGQFVTQLTEPAAAAGAPPGVDGLTADFYVRHSKAMAPILWIPARVCDDGPGPPGDEAMGGEDRSGRSGSQCCDDGRRASGCDFELLCQREQASERMGLCSGRRWRRTQR